MNYKEAKEKFKEIKQKNENNFNYVVKIKHLDGSFFRLYHASFKIIDIFLFVWTEHTIENIFIIEDLYEVDFKTMDHTCYINLINNKENNK